MKLPKSKKGIQFVAVYILLLIAAFIFAFFMITHNPSKSEFVGVYILILTLPWSLLGGILLDYLGLLSSVKFLDTIIYAIINSIILYFIGANIEKNRDSDRFAIVP